MAPDPILHERIYGGLKAALRSGRLYPGQHIDLTAISEEYRASVTPVREAVCRLVGEGLADFQRHGGFRVAPLRAEDLRGLYLFNAMILAHAIQLASDVSLDRALGSFWLPRNGADDGEVAAAAAILFSAIGEAAGSNIFQRTLDNNSDRLGLARIAELQVLRDVHGELLMMNHGPTGQLKKTLSRRVAQYHRRRSVAVEDIAKKMPGIIDG